MWKLGTVLLLLASSPIVNSKETPTPRMCAVCLEKDCATAVTRIYPAGGNPTVWVKANSTEIQNCSMENLKPAAPCKMANGSLIQQTKERLHFDEVDPRGVRQTFKSQNSPCADLNLPPGSTSSPGIKAAHRRVPTPATPNNSVADNKGSVIGIVIGILISI